MRVGATRVTEIEAQLRGSERRPPPFYKRARATLRTCCFYRAGASSVWDVPSDLVESRGDDRDHDDRSRDAAQDERDDGALADAVDRTIGIEG
jgi:hypothetical protein